MMVSSVFSISRGRSKPPEGLDLIDSGLINSFFLIFLGAGGGDLAIKIRKDDGDVIFPYPLSLAFRKDEVLPFFSFGFPLIRFAAELPVIPDVVAATEGIRKIAKEVPSQTAIPFIGFCITQASW